MPDRCAALGLWALAGLAWGLPMLFSRGREAVAPPPAALFAPAPGAVLCWAPGPGGAGVGADPRDGRVLGPDGAPREPVAGWPGLLFGHPLDLNRATQEDLEALPRIGPGLARAILADRAAQGPFPTVDSLTRVKGIGPKTLATLSPYLAARP